MAGVDGEFGGVSDQIVYHYCTASTGFSIVETKTIRLSALSHANDTSEGRAMIQKFDELIAATSLSYEVAQVCRVIFGSFSQSTEGFAFCMSENGDLLSQWRAYAGDGAGVVIGFNKSILERDFGEVNFGSKFFEIIKIEYGDAKLVDLLKPLTIELEKQLLPLRNCVQLQLDQNVESSISEMADFDLNRSKKIFKKVTPDANLAIDIILKIVSAIHFKIYSHKVVGFAEEVEWRLLRYRQRQHFQEIDYFCDGTAVKPFIPCFIAEPAKRSIESVTLGPKNKTDPRWMRAFLSSNGLDHVQVNKSSLKDYR